MSSKILRMAPMIVLVGLALSSAAWATCSNASVSGVYGFVDSGTDPSGTPAGTLWQAAFDSSTAKFRGTAISNQDGVIETGSISGTYAVASRCSHRYGYRPFAQDYTLFLGCGLFHRRGPLVSGKTGAANGGFLVAQGSPTCTNAGLNSPW
jgi:hypothetical protein